MKSFFLSAFLIFFLCEISISQIIIIPAGSSWKYLDDGSDKKATWRKPAFNDINWPSGITEAGFGDAPVTTLATGHITYYFRKKVSIVNPSQYANFTFKIRRDDGFVLYVNNIEVYRNNMAPLAVNYLKPASKECTDDGNAIITTTIPSTYFINGNNTIAIEIHNRTAANTDLTFDCELIANTTSSLPAITRGAYMDIATNNSITIMWRTNVACNSEVRFGNSLNGIIAYKSDTLLVTDHSVTVTGLGADKKYYYAIGTIGNIIQQSDSNYFYTAPVVGSNSQLRFWITGDYGKTGSVQVETRDSFISYIGHEKVNGWLMLGDNAYENGLDSEYQTEVFDFNNSLLKNLPLFPAIGNHDYANVGYQSVSALTTNFPYFSIFTLPQQSGTEKYYSYNYGNVHFITLDSYGAYNNPGSDMYNWLVNDLNSNSQHWTVVYFHHTPYTKTHHNSDTESELINMRQNIVPLLESYGVDLVLCGHSHGYERTYMIKGHTGLENTFNPSIYPAGNIVQPGGGPYYKSGSSTNGTVYVVCGAGSKLSTTPQAGYPHNAMYSSIMNLGGSGILEIHGDTLGFKFIANDGTIPDQFKIIKTQTALLKNGLSIPQNNLLIYPNPSSGDVSFNYESQSNSIEELEIIVTDVLSRTIYSELIYVDPNTTENIHIPFNQLNSFHGLCFVQLKRNNQIIHSEKLIIE